MRIKHLTVGAAASLVATTMLIEAQAAPAAANPVPKECYVSANAFTLDGVAGNYSYDEGRGVARISGYPKLGYEPRAVLPLGGEGGDGLARSTEFLVTPGGALILSQREARRTNGKWSYTRKNTTVRSRGFGYVRGLVASRALWDREPDSSYFYALTADGLVRYESTSGDTAISAGVWVGQKGWQTVKTLAYSHVEDTAGGPADVLLATTTAGELVEYTIPGDNPSQWKRTQIRPRSWNGFASLNVSQCGDDDARALLGIRPDGAGYVYYDKNKSNDAAPDISYGTKIASNWTLRTYNF